MSFIKPSIIQDLLKILLSSIVEHVNQCKYLGVNIDHKLSWVLPSSICKNKSQTHLRLPTSQSGADRGTLQEQNCLFCSQAAYKSAEY